MSSGNSIESVLHETRSFPPPEEFSAQANIKTKEEYQQMWQRAKDDPAGFWGEMAENLDWFQNYDSVHGREGGAPAWIPQCQPKQDRDTEAAQQGQP